MNSTAKKIIIYIACVFLALLTAFAVVAAIIHNLRLKTIYLSDDNASSSSFFSSKSQIIEPIISQPDFLNISEETVSDIKIDQVKEIIESVEPTNDNIIKVSKITINAIGLKNHSIKLPVKHLAQNPELPTGCEITALTTVLNYYGFNVSKSVMAANYLPKSTEFPANFWDVFLGDPTKSTGFGCYAKPIVDAANKYFKDNNADFIAVDHSGSQFESLLAEVENGTPVLIWGTSYDKKEKNLREPYTTYEWTIDGKKIQWIAPEHCMVLIGYDIDRGIAIISDPQRGIVEYDLETVKARYIVLHSQCVVIKRVDTHPVINGAINGEVYYVSQKITVTDDNLYGVTVNGISYPTEFIIEGNIDKVYEIVATDSVGHDSTLKIEMRTISSVLKPIQNINEKNVTSKNESLIERIKETIDSINAENATQQELFLLDKASSRCDALMVVIKNTSAKIAYINRQMAHYLLLGVSKKDEADLKELHNDISHLISTQNLTSNERKNLQSTLNKCDEYLLKIANKG